MTLQQTHSVTVTVNENMTADKVGSGAAKVFATPCMVALMERAALELAAAQLPHDKTTVGTAVNITHVSATPVGMRVTATAVLTREEGKLLEFAVSASDEAGLIGEGTHVRAVVDTKRFVERANAKLG